MITDAANKVIERRNAIYTEAVRVVRERFQDDHFGLGTEYTFDIRAVDPSKDLVPNQKTVRVTATMSLILKPQVGFVFAQSSPTTTTYQFDVTVNPTLLTQYWDSRIKLASQVDS